MNGKKIVMVQTAEGQIEANIFKSLLDAAGILNFLSQEGAGRAYGLGVGQLGRVEILVPEDRAAEARELLDQYYRGELEEEDDLNFEESADE